MKMQVTLASPQKTYFHGLAGEVSLRTANGEVTILPGHADYLAEISSGRMHISTDDGRIIGNTTNGLIYMHRNEVSIVLFDECDFREENDRE